MFLGEGEGEKYNTYNKIILIKYIQVLLKRKRSVATHYFWQQKRLSCNNKKYLRIHLFEHSLKKRHGWP